MMLETNLTLAGEIDPYYFDQFALLISQVDKETKEKVKREFA